MRTQADLVALTARLIDVPSVSGNEGAIADLVALELRPTCPPCDLVRSGNNVILRGPSVRTALDPRRAPRHGARRRERARARATCSTASAPPT
jgi:hypothetical protein